MRREQAQVVYLQETHLNNDEHKKLKLFFSSYKSGHRSGVAIIN